MTAEPLDIGRVTAVGTLTADKILATPVPMTGLRLTPSRTPHLDELPALADLADRLGWVHEPPETPMA